MQYPALGLGSALKILLVLESTFSIKTTKRECQHMEPKGLGEIREFVKKKRYELQYNVVSMFYVQQDSGMWQDALRVCKEYLPHKLPQLQDEYDREMTSSKSGKSVSLLWSLSGVCVCVCVCMCVSVWKWCWD